MNEQNFYKNYRKQLAMMVSIAPSIKAIARSKEKIEKNDPIKNSEYKLKFAEGLSFSKNNVTSRADSFKVHPVSISLEISHNSLGKKPAPRLHLKSLLVLGKSATQDVIIPRSFINPLSDKESHNIKSNDKVLMTQSSQNVEEFINFKVADFLKNDFQASKELFKKRVTWQGIDGSSRVNVAKFNLSVDPLYEEISNNSEYSRTEKNKPVDTNVQDSEEIQLAVKKLSDVQFAEPEKLEIQVVEPENIEENLSEPVMVANPSVGQEKTYKESKKLKQVLTLMERQEYISIKQSQGVKLDFNVESPFTTSILTPWKQWAHKIIFELVYLNTQSINVDAHSKVPNLLNYFDYLKFANRMISLLEFSERSHSIRVDTSMLSIFKFFPSLFKYSIQMRVNRVYFKKKQMR